MGWAERCHAESLWRAERRARAKQLALFLPRVIGRLAVVAVLALIVFPVRLAAFLAGRIYQRVIGGPDASHEGQRPGRVHLPHSDA